MTTKSLSRWVYAPCHNSKCIHEAIRAYPNHCNACALSTTTTSMPIESLPYHLSSYLVMVFSWSLDASKSTPLGANQCHSSAVVRPDQ
jgi:hypothetical protein